LPTVIAEQHVDQGRAERDLTDPERGAEVDRPEQEGGEDADEEAGDEDQQLTAHRF
jgi:hypothetical protein